MVLVAATTASNAAAQPLTAQRPAREISRDASAADARDEERDSAVNAVPRPAVPSSLPEYDPPHLWGSLSAVMLGPIVPGIGHYVTGQTPGGHRLLVLGGAGVGLALSGIAGLAATGASRYTVIPFGTLLAAGVSALSVAWLSDIFGTAMPARFRYVPEAGRMDGMWLSLGLEPQYAPSRPSALYGFASIDFRAERLRFRLDARWAATGRGHRVAAESAVALFEADASSAEVALRAEWGQPTDSQVQATTIDAVVRGRLHLGALLCSLRGSFVDWGWGLALANYRYTSGERNWHDMLRLEAGWGLWLPALGRGGLSEWKLYYTHRRDDLSGGLLVLGIGAGNLGAVGSRFSFWATPSWGGTVDLSLGAALSGRVTLDYRWGSSS